MNPLTKEDIICCNKQFKNSYSLASHRRWAHEYTDEQKKEIGKKIIKKKTGHKHTLETRERMSISRKDVKLSKEHKEKISNSLVGNKNSLGLVGELNACWKGEEAGYSTKHTWIRQRKGRPSKCEYCHTTEDRMYHWANISGEYFRNLDDWVRLCVPCHSKYDRGVIEL